MFVSALLIPVPAVALAWARSLARACSNGDNNWGVVLVLVGGNTADTDEEEVVVDELLEALTNGDMAVNGPEGPVGTVFADGFRTNTTLPAASKLCLISQEVSRGMYIVGGDCCRIDGDADCDGADGNCDGDDRTDETLLCAGLDIGGN